MTANNVEGKFRNKRLVKNAVDSEQNFTLDEGENKELQPCLPDLMG